LAPKSWHVTTHSLSSHRGTMLLYYVVWGRCAMPVAFPGISKQGRLPWGTLPELRDKGWV
jgi:hypothetical protein